MLIAQLARARARVHTRTHARAHAPRAHARARAEQLAILKSLEELSFLPDHKDRTVAIYTDSQVTLDSLRNNSIHTPIIAEIRKKVQQHTGIEGNELAERLAKEAAADDKLKVEYEKTTKSTIATGLKKEGIAK